MWLPRVGTLLFQLGRSQNDCWRNNHRSILDLKTCTLKNSEANCPHVTTHTRPANRARLASRESRHCFLSPLVSLPSTLFAPPPPDGFCADCGATPSGLCASGLPRVPRTGPSSHAVRDGASLRRWARRQRQGLQAPRWLVESGRPPAARAGRSILCCL